MRSEIIPTHWLPQGKSPQEHLLSHVRWFDRSVTMASEACLRPESAFYLLPVDRQRLLPRPQAREGNSTTH